jgi:hypothetical protein
VWSQGVCLAIREVGVVHPRRSEERTNHLLTLQSILTYHEIHLLLTQPHDGYAAPVVPTALPQRRH